MFSKMIKPYSGSLIAVMLICIDVQVNVAQSRAEDQKLLRIELPEVYELANIILALTEYGQTDPWEVRKDIGYYREITEYFSPYLSHPLLEKVNYSRERWKEYLSFRTDAYAFAFTETGELGRAFGFYANAGIAPFDDHLELIDDFVQKSRFREFYKTHSEYYQFIIDGYSKNYMLDEMKQFLANEFGDQVKGRNYRIVLSPLVYRMNCHRDINENTSADFPTVADYLLKGEKESAVSSKEKATEIHTLFTEMDHGYVNPVSERFGNLIDEKFDGTLWQDESGYNSNFSTFNEYMTWAVYDIFVQRYFPQVADEVSLYWHFQNKRRGFTYSALFSEKLKECYALKSDEQKMSDLYSELLNWSSEIQRQLSVPEIIEPLDSVVITKGETHHFELEFSEALLQRDSISVIIQDGRKKLEVLTLTKRENNVAWSGNGKKLSFITRIPEVDAPYLVFNWWGTRLALKSEKGVLLKSPSFIKIVKKLD